MGFTLDRTYGYPVVHQSGLNMAAGTDWEDVWVDGNEYIWLQQPEFIDILSDSSDDGFGGSGARGVTIIGLGEGFRPLTKTVLPLGLSRSLPTTEEFIRINSMEVDVCGTYSTLNNGGNAGTISCFETNNLRKQAQIDFDEIAFGISSMARYSVCLEADAYINSITFNTDSTMKSDFALFIREDADKTTEDITSKKLVKCWPGISGPFTYDPDVPLGPFPEKSDIWIASRAALPNTAVSADMEIILVTGQPT